MNMIRKIFATRRPTPVKTARNASVHAYFRQFASATTDKQLDRVALRYRADKACGISLDLQWRDALAGLALDAGCEFTTRLINTEMGGGN